MDNRRSTLRLIFEKSGPARWIGHLDIMRAFERAVRRAGIRVALTEGHNPRPRLRFVFPASVGLVCRADVLFVDVENGCEQITADLLNAALPPGLIVHGVSDVLHDERKSALAEHELAEYRIAFPFQYKVSSDQMHDAARRMMDRGSIIVTRTGSSGERELDIRPFIVSLRPSLAQADQAVVMALTRFGNEGTVKPSELAEAIRCEMGVTEAATIERTRLLTRVEAETAHSAS